MSNFPISMRLFKKECKDKSVRDWPTESKADNIILIRELDIDLKKLTIN